jgi:hypothetical protein
VACVVQGFVAILCFTTCRVVQVERWMAQLSLFVDRVIYRSTTVGFLVVRLVWRSG